MKLTVGDREFEGVISSVAVLLALANSGCTNGHAVEKPVVTVEGHAEIGTKPQTMADDPLVLDQATIEKCKRATVLIGNFEGGELTAVGSGFVAGDGTTVVTAKHLVTGTNDTVDDCKLVFFSGTSSPKLVTVNSSDIAVNVDAHRNDDKYFEQDVAAITLPGKVTEPLDWEEAADLTETRPAWGLGYPAGTRIRMDTQDLPSPTVHSMRIERIEKAGDEIRVIQLDGSVTHGDSGGPVVDRDGKVIGVLQAKESDSTIVYAVPTHTAESLLNSSERSHLVASDWLKPLGKKESPDMVVPRDDSKTVSVLHSYLDIKDLDETDLEGVSAKALTLLSDEPFARRGFIFDREDVQNEFDHVDWYTPKTHDLKSVQDDLTEREKKNILFVQGYQRDHDEQW